MKAGSLCMGVVSPTGVIEPLDLEEVRKRIQAGKNEIREIQLRLDRLEKAEAVLSLLERKVEEGL